MKRFSPIKTLGTLLAGMAAGFALAISFTFWGSDGSPQFYGALTASLVAAATLIFGAFYNDFLARKREEDARIRERTAAAIDLHFWLAHCAEEFDFIVGALKRLQTKLVQGNKTAIDFSMEQFKEIISSHFYKELLDRATAASKLPPEMAGYIAGQIYKVFTTVDRMYALKHASDEFLPTTEQIGQYISLTVLQKEKLQRASGLLEEYLIDIHALPRFPKD